MALWNNQNESLILPMHPRICLSNTNSLPFCVAPVSAYPFAFTFLCDTETEVRTQTDTGTDAYQ